MANNYASGKYSIAECDRCGQRFMLKQLRKEIITYLEKTWIGTGESTNSNVLTNALFDRTVWNFHANVSFRTNNISETYNKRMNGLISKPNPSIFAMIDIIKNEECLTSVNFEKAKLKKLKPRMPQNVIKDLEITNLKLRYDCGELEVMDYLMQVSNYVKEFDY